MPRILLTTPLNAYLFSTPIDTYDDFFLSYPWLRIENDSLYFRGSHRVLLLKDGVPIPSLHSVPFPSIQSVELLAEDPSPLYGDYDAVINIITKKFKNETPYSNIKLLKKPDHVQFEFGRALFNSLDFYITADLNSPPSWSANIGYSKKFLSLRAYSDSLLQGSLFSNLRFYVTPNSFCLTRLLNLKNHKLLLGTENLNAFIIQDYWEPYPLLYIVPALRIGTEGILGQMVRKGLAGRVRLPAQAPLRFYPKISIGFIPRLDVTIFSSLTPNQINLGARIFESNISLFCSKKNFQQECGSEEALRQMVRKGLVGRVRLPAQASLKGMEAILSTPCLRNFKLTAAYQLTIPSDYFTIMAEYQKKFKEGDLGVYILGDLYTKTLRLELQIIDGKIFYRYYDIEIIHHRLRTSAPSYGLKWEFWD